MNTIYKFLARIYAGENNTIKFRRFWFFFYRPFHRWYKHSSFLQKKLMIFFVLAFLISCSSRKIMVEEDAQFKDINDEFNHVVRVDEIKPPANQKKKSRLGQDSEKNKSTFSVSSGEDTAGDGVAASGGSPISSGSAANANPSANGGDITAGSSPRAGGGAQNQSAKENEQLKANDQIKINEQAKTKKTVVKKNDKKRARNRRLREL